MRSKVTQLIPSFSRRYFEEYSEISQLRDCSLFMTRQDGVLVYHKNGLGDKLDPSAVGALLGGVWQAAQALVSFIPNHQDASNFRLSFDTSSQGLYVQPLFVRDELYYLGLLYSEEVNPAMIKSKLRILTQNFIKYLESELETASVTTSQSTNDSYLFSNITDEEMDKLFKFAEL